MLLVPYYLLSLRFDEENIYLRTRSGHVTTNTWGWIWAGGVGKLRLIPYWTDIGYPSLHCYFVNTIAAKFVCDN